MSMFLVHRKKEYAIILADYHANRENKIPLFAPKLTRVAPCVFATHAGNWQPAYEILSNFHDYLIASPRPRTFDEIVEYLEQDGNRCFQKWCEAWSKDTIDVRVPIVLTGKYRHLEDISNEISSTFLIVETANKFKARRINGGFFAYDDEITQVALALVKVAGQRLIVKVKPSAQ